MHVLLTGGAGFIGLRLTRRLVETGHRVRVLDALLDRTHPDGVVPAFPDEVEFVHGDLRDPDTTARALDGIELVSHHAAIVGRGQEIRDAGFHASHNDLATGVLVAGMAEAGVGRLVLASTVALYGSSHYECPEHGRVLPADRTRADLDRGFFEPRCPACGAGVAQVPVDESDVPDPPRNIYAITKLAQEHLAGAFARETGASVTALRYHNVYGPDIAYQNPYSGVAAAFRSMVARGDAPEVFEDGAPLRDFVHVDDVVEANLAALAVERPDFRAYNVASGTPHSIGDVAAALAAAVGGPEPVVTGRYRMGDVRHIVATPARIREELGWRPTVDFATGMKEFATAPMRGGG